MQLPVLGVQLLLVCCFIAGAAAKCPFAHLANVGVGVGSSSVGRELLWSKRGLREQVNVAAVQALNISGVEQDLKALMTKSQPWWPADNGHYGGLMIRLAWHCSGSYRTWDGRGGCNGARIRFNPELSWDDNTNLDKARRLLEPIKAKYGDALSWGDLIVLAGSTAIDSMGGPNIGVCLGRIDDADGTASLPLGPTPEQELIAPCKRGDGMCEQPLGQTTMGLIYVNPEGVNGQPLPENSVEHIRSTFARMGMNDQETVALIGGGHAFGKTHGACATGAGPNPKEDPDNPWPGTCGSGPLQGKGPNTYTSGFEGSWTTTPTQWSNEYFKNLLAYDWEKYMGPGGRWQWGPKLKATPAAGANANPEDTSLPNIMMLTSDVALLKDPVYLKWVQTYAADQDSLTRDFGNAWYKLTTRSMGPVSRCLGSKVPPPQSFQMPLPAPSTRQPDWAAVRADLNTALSSKRKVRGSVLLADMDQGALHFGPQFATLAWQCASTFRSTDFLGGCNGARIRFPPEKDWAGNGILVDSVLANLRPIKAKHPDITWSDLIVLAGTVAVEHAISGLPAKQQAQQQQAVISPFGFCPGRTDASDGAGSDILQPRNYSDPAVAIRDNAAVMGLTLREAVVLSARPRSAAHQMSLGLSGTWTDQPAQTSNTYFKLLLGLEWSKRPSFGLEEYQAPMQSAAALLGSELDWDQEGQYVYMTPSDMVIKWDPELSEIAKEFISDKHVFVREFAEAWTKVMNADRFKGPAGSECATFSQPAS